MTSTIIQDGVTYVERDYKCLDCDWTWNQVCVKNDALDVAKCPNCHNADKYRFGQLLNGETVKTRVAKNKPKKREVKPGMPAYNARGQRIKKAAQLGFEEAQKQGFSDMKDSGLRIGDVCAPPLNSLVSNVQDNVFKGGWGGTQAAAYKGAMPTDAGAGAMLGSMQKGIMEGKIVDKLGGLGNLKR